MADSLAERLRKNEEARRTRTERELAAAEAPPPAREKPAPKKKPKEKVGTGASSFDLEGAIAKIRKQIAATSDPNLKAKLEARIKALKENQ